MLYDPVLLPFGDHNPETVIQQFLYGSSSCKYFVIIYGDRNLSL